MEVLGFLRFLFHILKSTLLEDSKLFLISFQFPFADVASPSDATKIAED